MKCTENTIKVIEALRQANGEDTTANDLANKTGLSTKQINAIFNSVVKKGLGFRKEVEGKEHKCLYLTDVGKTREF